MLSSLESNADDLENDNDAVEENDIPLIQPTKEELEKVISSALRAAFCSHENGFEMRTLVLKFESAFTKARIQRMK